MDLAPLLAGAVAVGYLPKFASQYHTHSPDPPFHLAAWMERHTLALGLPRHYPRRHLCPAVATAPGPDGGIFLGGSPSALVDAPVHRHGGASLLLGLVWLAADAASGGLLLRAI